jgi:hypothetical protein
MARPRAMLPAPFVHAHVRVMVAMVEEADARTIGAVLRRLASCRFVARRSGRGGDGRTDHHGQGHR